MLCDKELEHAGRSCDIRSFDAWRKGMDWGWGGLPPMQGEERCHHCFSKHIKETMISGTLAVGPVPFDEEDGLD